eukprot:CAMPEP_0203899090 /NCGR_PEP_ID=MMETSP0359-20131031/41545_1 /ASSEMBLY_ACC=CAM_ASM_000338 /TAXON_ID=268821 /ORGANISM="Scrippsiella Hangoei, Strain SHTV-5" /LENGTH=218 /DNA_ID=CAMNT_0050822279 /DNA_START=542 /DNA_END=1196 /DNA_ORIENTATION=+
MDRWASSPSATPEEASALGAMRGLDWVGLGLHEALGAVEGADLAQNAADLRRALDALHVLRVLQVGLALHEALGAMEGVDLAQNAADLRRAPDALHVLHILDDVEGNPQGTIPAVHVPPFRALGLGEPHVERVLFGHSLHGGEAHKGVLVHHHDLEAIRQHVTTLVALDQVARGPPRDALCDATYPLHVDGRDVLIKLHFAPAASHCFPGSCPLQTAC